MSPDTNSHSAIASAPRKAARDPHHVLKAWTAAILWLIVIAIESTAWLSANNTGRILYPMFHFLFGLSWDQFDEWHFFIRKGGHLIGYGLLSFFLFRAWRETLPALLSLGKNIGWTLRWSALAVLGTALVAGLDEWHQSFIPSRSGRWQDVVLDTCAAVAAQFLIFLFCRSWSSKLRTD